MKKLIYLMLGLLIIGFTSCKDDEEVKPEPPVETPATSASIDFTINHTVGDIAYTAGTQYLVGNNDKATFSRYAYLLGSFYLIAEDGSTIPLDDQYALIEAHDGKTSFSFSDIPYGTYTSIGFSIGLDSATNHGNPNQYDTDHPLSSLNNSLHWGWTGGYIFTAIEGKDMTADESIIFHLAGVQNKTDFELPAAFVHGEKGSTIDLGYDIAEVFKAPSLFSFAMDGRSSHSTSGPVTSKLISNMVDVFSVNSASSK
jgi:hypothetical protein